jgi:hypothetical protein
MIPGWQNSDRLRFGGAPIVLFRKALWAIGVENGLQEAIPITESKRMHLRRWEHVQRRSLV